MGIFKGKIVPRGGLDGNLTGKSPKIKATVANLTKNPGGQISPVGGYYGGLRRVGAFFQGTVKKLYVLYRFIFSENKIAVYKRGKASKAPSKLIKTRSALSAKKQASADSFPTKNISVVQTEIIKPSAWLASYRRTALNFFGKIFDVCHVNLFPARGAVVNIRKNVEVGRSAQVETADSAVTKSRYNSIPCKCDASIIVADTVNATKNESLVAVRTVLTEAAEGICVSAKRNGNPISNTTLNKAYEVTFKTHDGIVLYSCLVNYGQDCIDPVAAGIIAEPTRESDGKYHYIAFTGWSKISEGSANETALQNITSPRTIYPAFEKELRYYSISFYDGAVLLVTLSVAYGDTPQYTPIKSGYQFVGWTPDVVPVTGDAAYGAIWISDYLASGTCGEFATWGLTKTGELIISGTGAMADYTAAAEQPWYAYATEVKTVTIEPGITTIGDYSLRNLSNLTAIYIPDGVVSVGAHSLRNTPLTSVTFPDSVQTIKRSVFSNCTNLVSVNIPDGVAVIDLFTFQNCTSLTSLSLPESITTIGEYAFQGCTKLLNINTASAAGVGVHLENCPITEIGCYAFEGCTSIQYVYIPDTVTLINYRAFQNCSNLLYIIFGAGLRTIGDHAFLNCARLQEVDFGANKWADWYACNSSTATTGSRFWPASYTNSGLVNLLRSTYASKWIKRF